MVNIQKNMEHTHVSWKITRVFYGFQQRTIWKIKISLLGRLWKTSISDGDVVVLVERLQTNYGKSPFSGWEN